MEERFRVLIIEADAAIRSGLIAVFEHHHFDIDATDSGSEGYDKACRESFDLVLLDASSPCNPTEKDGFDICRGIREKKRGQIIFMLTPNADNEEILHRLPLGADDYTSIPFAYTELVQRAKALLRRSKLQAKSTYSDRIRFGKNIDLDVAGLSGQCQGHRVEFTPREMRLVEYLYENRGKAVQSPELINQLWGYPRYLEVETRALDIHMTTLQQKIEADPEKPVHFKKMGGSAYQLSL